MDNFDIQKKNVDGYQITTFSAVVTDANVLAVEVGTNGYHGGDSGHGCRTYLHIENLASSDISIVINDDKRGVSIFLGGDSELTTFIEVLGFAYRVLKHQAQGGD